MTQGDSTTHAADLDTALQLLDDGRPAAARPILEAIAKQQPGNAAVAALLAEVCLTLRAHQAATTWATTATTLAPENDEAWRSLAIARTWSRDHAGARRAADRATEIAPANWRNHVTIAAVDSMSRQTVTDATWAAATEAIRLAPDELEPYLVAADIATRQGHADAADKFYDQALVLAPDSVSIRRRRLTAQADAGKSAEAAAGLLDLLDAGAAPDAAMVRALSRTGLRLLEGVNAILLVALLLVGVVAAFSLGSSGLNPAERVGEAVVLVAAAVVLVVAWSRYRGRLQHRSVPFLRALASWSPVLVVLASMQGIALLALVVVVVLLVAALHGAGAVLAVASLVALGLLVVALLVAGVARATS